MGHTEESWNIMDGGDWVAHALGFPAAELPLQMEAVHLTIHT